MHGVGSCRVKNGECQDMQAFEEGQAMAHEGVTEVAEVCTILHFFGEGIRGVAFTTDMSNSNSTLFDLLVCNILFELDLMIAF
jgi:hypothetical protein